MVVARILVLSLGVLAAPVSGKELMKHLSRLPPTVPVLKALSLCGGMTPVVAPSGFGETLSLLRHQEFNTHGSRNKPSH